PHLRQSCHLIPEGYEDRSRGLSELASDTPGLLKKNECTPEVCWSLSPMKFRHPSRGGALRGRDPGVALASSLTPGYGPCIPPGYPPAVLQRNRRRKDVGNAEDAPPLFEDRLPKRRMQRRTLQDAAAPNHAASNSRTPPTSAPAPSSHRAARTPS